VESDVLTGVLEPADFIISNPPYLVDAKQRTYRNGGGDWGCDLSRRILEESTEKLERGGKLLLYSGTPIVNGTDVLLQTLRPILASRTTAFRYEEVDPDVFGEELEQAPYGTADRLAVVTLTLEERDLKR
jgi:methylase of polypeptide subunit release factors